MNSVPDVAVIGFSHKTASVDERECFSMHYDILPEFYQKLKDSYIGEAVYMATCNRVETYVAAKDIRTAVEKIIKIYEDISGKEYVDFKDNIYVKYSRDAVAHLLTVISGLDSMVLGENEIVGQVKDAFTHGIHNKSAGPALNKLFHMAFRTAKQVRTETDISKNPLSVAFIATDLAKSLFDDFNDRKALLIGAGEMGELILKYFTKYNIGKITVANRSLHNSERIANEIDREVEIILLDDIEEASCEVDIIISSVSAPHYMVTAEMAKEIMQVRQDKPIFLIDIAVPRNIDPNVGDIKNIHLYNIDDLQSIADENLKSRLSEAELAREFIDANVKEFYEWHNELSVAPTIVSIQKQFDEIRTMELDRYRKKKMKHLSEDDFLLIEELTKQIMTKTLHNPIVNLKRHHRCSHDEKEEREHLHRKTKFIEELFVDK